MNLQELKNTVKQMSENEQSALRAADSEVLLNMVMATPELEPVKHELNRNFNEVKQLAGK